MTETGEVALSQEMMKRVAHRLMESHGRAALAVAALTASRSARVNVTEEARFWLGVCNEIRAARADEAMEESRIAAIH